MAKRSAPEEMFGSNGGLNAFESRLVNVLALMLVKERSQTDQIQILARAGFRHAEIAQLVGTTAATVRVTVYQQKKTKAGSKQKSK